MVESQNSSCFGRWVRELTKKGHKKTFQGDDNVLYLNRLKLCKLYIFVEIMICAFYCYINISSKEKNYNKTYSYLYACLNI